MGEVGGWGVQVHASKRSGEVMGLLHLLSAAGPAIKLPPTAVDVALCAGTFPLVFSLLGDLFEPRQRAAIAAVVQLATGVGLAVGQGIAGFVGARVLAFTGGAPSPCWCRIYAPVYRPALRMHAVRNMWSKLAASCPEFPAYPSHSTWLSVALPAGSSIGWRWPFVIVAVPSIVAAVVMVLTTDEPPRGVTEHALHQAFEVGTCLQGLHNQYWQCSQAHCPCSGPQLCAATRLLQLGWGASS